MYATKCSMPAADQALKKDMEIERYLRDGKAGWVMGPTNEILRQFVGKSALLGFESLDYWNQSVNERMLHNELKKMTAEDKRKLAEILLAEVDNSETLLKRPEMAMASTGRD